MITIVPLLKNDPEPQNVSVTRRRGDAMLSLIFQRAPQAVFPSIIRGSLEARSKKIARFGETIMTSRAITPLSPTRTNSQPDAEAEIAPARATSDVDSGGICKSHFKNRKT